MGGVGAKRYAYHRHPELYRMGCRKIFFKLIVILNTTG